MDDKSQVQLESDTLSPHEKVAGDFVVLNKNTDHIDDGLIAYADALEAIDENKAAAKLNEVSMVGNNGSRIYY